MATAKKTTKKKSAPKKAKVTDLRSFKLSKESTPFVSFKITNQTIYWSILLILILILALWVLQIQINISDVLNTIR
ncbi:MAG TPA: hypothetical protein VMR16_01895 [Candidatus Saccharimonadales bacterium]|nr:hypothetical protein [Candidatus Saccharimonadales bacterium]